MRWIQRHICAGLRQKGGQKRSRLSTDSRSYDVIVVGGGHAGTEAACASARTGAKTLLVTHKIETIGAMSCNPSFGGIGKGHLMREVDAMDGVCARICDKSGIQYKILNRRKGPAVWGPRAQIDRKLYREHMQREVLSTPNLTVLASPVEDFLLEQSDQPDHPLMKQKCCGIVLDSGDQIRSRTVVLTTGTFLRGCINIGLTWRPAGRIGDEPAVGLARSLEQAGFTMGRLKTGTPPRLDKNTIDFSRTTPMGGDNPPVPFSFLNTEVWIKPEEQLPCHMTHTGEGVERVVRETLHLNKHVQEETQGPRYCPSIESKILRFKGRRHQIWLEPEGLDSELIYPNGISCTMPEEHQVRLIQSIQGLESCRIVQHGYGVEYDFLDPRQLKGSLETHRIQNLFLAGQINGTTGYEEAAAQGLLAGLNAALRARGREAVTLGRTEAYLGVMVDDLTTHGTTEPYRMFTARAEFRLALRPDNADLRLTEKGFQAGCVSRERREHAQRRWRAVQDAVELLKELRLSDTQWRRTLGLGSGRMVSGEVRSAFHMLLNPSVSVAMLVDAFPQELGHLSHDPSLQEQLLIEAKYMMEMKEQEAEISEIRRDEQLLLPDDLDYFSLNISTDAKEKLTLARPATIAAASRIPGMTPAAILRLLRHVKRRQAPSKETSPALF